MIVGAAILAALQSLSSQKRIATKSDVAEGRVAGFQTRCLAAHGRPLRLGGSIVRLGSQPPGGDPCHSRRQDCTLNPPTEWCRRLTANRFRSSS